MNAFTDGATSNNGKLDARGGWAYIVVEDPEKEVHSAAGHVPNATNNKCELLAAINACRWLRDNDKNNAHIIFTDSAYITNCYNQKWYKKWQINGWKNSSKQPVANQELWEQLIPFFEDYNFTFYKVEGHSRPTSATAFWNDKVDKMAVNAKNN